MIWSFMLKPKQDDQKFQTDKTKKWEAKNQKQTKKDMKCAKVSSMQPAKQIVLWRYVQKKGKWKANTISRWEVHKSEDGA